MDDTITVYEQRLGDYLVDEDYADVLMFDLRDVLHELNADELQRLEN